MSNSVFVWIDQPNGKADTIAWEALGAARNVADALDGQVVAIVQALQKSSMVGTSQSVYVPGVYSAQPKSVPPFN